MKNQTVFIISAIALLGLLYWKRTALASAIYKTLPAKAKVYLSAFQKADVDNRLPEGMTGKVALIESNFNPAAVSTKGATGLMQIVPSWHPGVNANDPVASIAYAGQYLRRLYNRFGDWNKALAAYNWGEGNLSKAITQYGDKWFNYVPAETRKYVVKYHAIQSFA